MANKVGDYMKKTGIKFIRGAVPTEFAKNSSGQKVVTYKQGEEEIEDIYDTVMLAIGRSADTEGLNLGSVGVKTADNGKIIAYDDDVVSDDLIGSTETTIGELLQKNTAELEYPPGLVGLFQRLMDRTAIYF